MTRIKPYFETKYLLSTAQASDLYGLLRPATIADGHGESGNYEICSIYYDTPALDFFNDKIHGLYSKTKVRIRFYRNRNHPEWHDACIEIKQRNGSLVTKHRAQLGPDFFIDQWLDSPDFSVRDQILQTLKNAQTAGNLAGKRLIPTAMVFYQRRAMQFNGIEGLRFTFDSQIAGIRPSSAALRHDFNFSDHAAFNRAGNVFEIKAYAQPPESILSQLENMGIRQVSFSKYSTSLQRLLERSNDARLII